MKRSDMISFIEGLFSLASGHDNNTNAENLLCHLEELGMQPPLVNTEIKYTNGSAVKLVSRWEKE